MNAQGIQPNSGSVIVTEATLPHGIIFKNKELLNNINFWHKFTIYYAEKSSRNEVLGAILDHVHPLDLIPVSYWKDSFGSHFLARNCGPAIQKFCKDNLVVPRPNNSSPYRITITLKFATTSEFKIDVQKNILMVLSKRYNTLNRTLNLTKFYEDPGLTEFCALSQPKIMFFVLHLTKSLIPAPETYILSNNRIKLLNPLESICTSTQLKCLDLRNNLLENIDILKPLKQFKLTELYLDGNPLCENINAREYISEVTNIVKNLSKLDGVPVKNGGFPAPNKIFLCDSEGLDLVNQFLEHYFYIFDSQNRKLIQELYHKNALFSLNSIYHNNQLSSASTRLYKYNIISRNLHKLADFSQNVRHLYRGNQQIVHILTNLPATEHDPYSFTVDLIYYTARCAIIGVSGAFRERPESLLSSEKVYGFRRIFTLETVNGDGLCYITNEECHIHNALSWQVLESFKTVKMIGPPVMQSTVPQSENDYQKVIETHKLITTLNSEWSKKCLEECSYDLKRALTLFVDLYKQNRIPDEGFEDAKKNK